MMTEEEAREMGLTIKDESDGSLGLTFDDNDLLIDLADKEGMDVEEMLQAAMFDSVVPGICRECGCTAEVEPDNAHGWCPGCGENKVASALVLAGLH